MYLKNIAIKNIGPINELSVEMPFNENGNPQPIIFVGENGTGKTILQSQIVDGLYEIGSEIFHDIAKSNGLRRDYYKISGRPNLQAGKNEGFSALIFVDNKDGKIEYFDKIGKIKKEDITALLPDFKLSPSDEKDNQKTITSINETSKNNLQDEWMTGAHFYQPAYRYEEPFWKNDSFLDNSRFKDQKRFSGKLDKEIEVISATKENKSYLMDLVLDLASTQNETDTVIWANINNILKKIKKKEDIRFGIGPRGNVYRISIVETTKDGKVKSLLLPSIDNLSLGEAVLLNLFITIVRHGDKPPKLTHEIKGLVLIDEIDVHLHTDLQFSVLPELIKLFPKVQFIITTHSPLFLLGMEKTFGDDGFEIRNLPNGEIITAERFSEFGKAYKVLKDTEQFERELQNKIIENQKTKVYVEGPTDVKYIKKAFEFYDKQSILKKVDIEIIGEETDEGTRYSNNDALKNAGIFLKLNQDIIFQTIILLHDPEVAINEKSFEEKLFIRKMPSFNDNPLQKGIENLFSKDFIDAVHEENEECFQFQTVGKEVKNFAIVNGKKQIVCEWICQNGSKDDFVNFYKIIEIIENIIDGKNQ